MFLSDTATAAAFAVFAQGLVLSLGLIVAIGAQNAFVLRQGLRKEHVGSVVVFCAAADALLIAAGVLGMAEALGSRPMLARALALAGAAFLALYGWRALRRSMHPQQLTAAAGGCRRTWSAGRMPRVNAGCWPCCATTAPKTNETRRRWKWAC